MVDPKLIPLLRCPIDGAPLVLADESLVVRVNEAIQNGSLRDRLDQRIERPIDQGLWSQRAGRLYPVRQSIPALIADESIDVSSLIDGQ